MTYIIFSSFTSYYLLYEYEYGYRIKQIQHILRLGILKDWGTSLLAFGTEGLERSAAGCDFFALGLLLLTIHNIYIYTHGRLMPSSSSYFIYPLALL